MGRQCSEFGRRTLQVLFGSRIVFIQLVLSFKFLFGKSNSADGGKVLLLYADVFRIGNGGNNLAFANIVTLKNIKCFTTPLKIAATVALLLLGTRSRPLAFTVAVSSFISIGPVVTPTDCIWSSVRLAIVGAASSWSLALAVCSVLASGAASFCHSW